MNRPTRSRSKISCLLVIAFPVALAACGAQASDAAIPQTAHPTFSKDRVAQEAPVEVRRMLSSGGGNGVWSFETMSPSPDGRYLTDIGWQADGGASVLDVATGEETQIPNQAHTGFTDTGSAFSPDGSRVAYTYAGSNGYEVRSIGVDGSDPTVHQNPGYFAEVADWSTDGQHLLINGYPAEGGSHLATIDVTTNEYRVLKTVDTRVGISFFSPDGRFVAFDVYAPDSRERDISLVSSDGSQETTLIRTPDYERLLGWLPDGSGILFHRDAEDSQAIWKLPMRNGQPSGPPELVKDDVWDMTPFGFSDDAYFYGVTVSRRGVHTASFDLETGRVLEALEPVSDPSGLGSDFATWSPDGTRIVYFATVPGRNNERRSRIIVQSLTGEILQDLPLVLNRPIHAGWTAHGLVVWERGSRVPPAGFYLVSLETGEATYLRKSPRGGSPFSVSEDGSSFFIGDPGGQITEYDLSTGTERILMEQDGYALVGLSDDPDARIAEPAQVSPDGDSILYNISRKALEIYSRSTGESRVIPGFTRLIGTSWSPDSRYVVLDGQLEGSGNHQLLRVSVEDGSVIVLAEGPERFHRPKVSPDGRHVLVTTGEERQEIWRMTFNSGR